MTFTTNPPVGESLTALAGMDLGKCAGVLGAEFDGRGLQIPIYDRTYVVTPDGIADGDGRPPTEALAEVLCQYVLRRPEKAPDDGQRVTFRELDGAGPLVAGFADNTNKLIAGTFAARLPDLEAVSRRMGALTESDKDGFDLFVRFNALPKVPIYLQFNAADDLFPAQAALLFHMSAQTFLDMASLFKLGTYLAGRLISGTNA